MWKVCVWFIVVELCLEKGKEWKKKKRRKKEKRRERITQKFCLFFSPFAYIGHQKLFVSVLFHFAVVITELLSYLKYLHCTVGHFEPTLYPYMKSATAFLDKSFKQLHYICDKIVKKKFKSNEKDKLHKFTSLQMELENIQWFTLGATTISLTSSTELEDKRNNVYKSVKVYNPCSLVYILYTYSVW